ncbi:MAG: recombination protein RecR [Rhodobacteraceae bacterium]|nr:recombination protein RecR [Paracoccaceae bacterium]
MTGGPEEIARLIELLARLPGMGPRSARRAVLHMVKKRDQLLLPLAEAMADVGHNVGQCLSCGNITTADLCTICTNNKRANGQICVVGDVSDLWALERASVYGGRYHVLGGTLSALDEIGPDELGIPRLQDRIAAEDINELILALPATVDGLTTAHYIADQLPGLTITTLAQGVPIGGELDYLDEGTITAALNARRSL